MLMLVTREKTAYTEVDQSEFEAEVSPMLNARNDSLRIGDMDMDYISFGNGTQPFVMLPGLGDSLKTVKGTAFPFAIMYRVFAKYFKVFVFSRKNGLPSKYSIRDMADDQAQAMKLLGISNACVMGISQGGMIAMHLAAAHPELVNKLVLGNTAARSSPTMQRVVGKWLDWANIGDFKSLFIDTAEKTYSEKKLKTYRPLYPLLAAASKPKSLDRFVTQGNACLAHDASAELGRIKCPTLVFGGGHDKIVGIEAAPELAKGIQNSELFICEEFGHGAYEEYRGFNEMVLRFLRE
jgi:pimeloyl-ACP methyl ester carboxylesterase